MIKAYEWFLITLQHLIKLKSFKAFKVYSLVKAEEKRRSEEGEPPFEDLWTIKIKAFVWRLIHYLKTNHKSSEVVGAYYTLLQKLAQLAEDYSCIEFMSCGFRLRLSGGTIVIAEKFAVNGSGLGVYVHKRETPDHKWELVYRTNWLINDIEFIGLMKLACRGDCFPCPVQNALYTTVNTNVN
jgi:hypothetical protein